MRDLIGAGITLLRRVLNAVSGSTWLSASERVLQLGTEVIGEGANINN